MTTYIVRARDNIYFVSYNFEQLSCRLIPSKFQSERHSHKAADTHTQSTWSVHLHRSITQVEQQLHTKQCYPSPTKEQAGPFLHMRYVIAMLHSSNRESILMIRARGIKVHTNKKAQLYRTKLSLQTKGFLLKCNTLVESEFKLAQAHQCLRVGVLIYLFPVTVHRLVQKADTDSTASMTVS